MATSRNRVIYQSESLFVSEKLDSITTGKHHECIRVQSANYGFTINRQDVNQYGNLARIDSLVLESPTVNFDFSYYLGDGLNEKAMGFNINEAAQFASGHLETSSGRNFYMITSNEGIDSVDFLAADEYSVIGLGNAFLSDYTVDLAVGSIPTVNVTYEASNINSHNGTVTGTLPSNLGFSGSLPAIQPSLGDVIPGTASIRTPRNTGDNGPTALRPGDITLEFPGFDEGGAESGTISTISGNGAFHVQSASLSIPLSRTPIEKVGSKFPFARVVDFPANGTLTVNAILNTIESNNLASIIAGCAQAGGKEVAIKVNTCEGPEAIRWRLKGATLDAESFSSSIGANKTVDLTFGVQLGGVNDTSQGVVCSGAADSRQVFAP